MAVDRSNMMISLAMGVLGAALAPVIAPMLRRSLRPVAKTAIRGAFSLYRKGATAAAEMGEQFEDLVAEARAEGAARQPMSAAAAWEAPAADADAPDAPAGEAPPA